MARLAATEFGADWVLNTDADEFWLPRGGDFRSLFAAVPSRYGVVRGAWRNFVPRPDDDRFFAERMTARLCRPSFHPHPLSIHFKSAHRAVPDVRVGRGNHEAFGAGLVALRGWYPIEILHFPVRSLAHCMRKYVTQFVALERNAEKGIPGHMADAYEAYRAGRLEAFYAPLVVDDDALERGIRSGELAMDTRLRDRLASLGFGAVADPPAGERDELRRGRARSRARPRRSKRRTSASRTRRVSIGSNGVSPVASRGSAVGHRDRGLDENPRVRSDPAGGSSCCSRSHSRRSGSRHSGGRWRRDATPGTTSRTTSSSSTRSHRSPSSSSSGRR